MKSPSLRSAEFMMEFANLAARLVEINVTTASANLDFCYFGSWTVNVQRGFEELKASYDGKDEFISIEVSPIDQYTSHRTWKSLEQRPIGRSVAISHLERVIRGRYPLAPKPPSAT
jgi:hypothetical protein